MKQLRVGQITLTMGQGGIENLIVSLARVADSAQIEYRLYCLDAGGELLAETEKLGMRGRVFSRKPGFDWSLIFSLAQAFREDGLDVVHTHNQAAHFYGALAARVAGVRFVINTEHSRHNIQDHWRRRFEKRMLAKMTTTMVTVSEELRQLSIENDGISPGKLAVIVNGVDIQRFENVRDDAVAALRMEKGVSISAKVLCIVARLHPIKNHTLLLQSVKILTNDYPDIRLLVVGDGDERQSLENLAHELGITNNVLFMGNRSDVPVILKASDAVVLCSRTEGLPLALLEAMAAQTPIIVTKGANRSDLITHGSNGLVAGDQPEELAVTILRCISQKNRSIEMAAVAYSQVMTNYSIEKTAADYLNIYTQRQC